VTRRAVSWRGWRGWRGECDRRGSSPRRTPPAGTAGNRVHAGLLRRRGQGTGLGGCAAQRPFTVDVLARVHGRRDQPGMRWHLHGDNDEIHIAMPGQAGSMSERMPGSEPVPCSIRALGAARRDRRKGEVRRGLDSGYVRSCRSAPVRAAPTIKQAFRTLFRPPPWQAAATVTAATRRAAANPARPATVAEPNRPDVSVIRGLCAATSSRSRSTPRTISPRACSGFAV